jgi:hypothetical protein
MKDAAVNPFSGADTLYEAILYALALFSFFLHFNARWRELNER